MTRIKINPDLTRQNSAAFSRAASDLVNMHWDLNRLAGQLDWEVRSRGNVESKISGAATQGKQLYEEVERLADYLKRCAAGMEEADCQGQQCLSATSAAYVSTGAVLGTVAAGGLLAGLIAGGKNMAITALGWIKQRMGLNEYGAVLNADTIPNNPEEYSNDFALVAGSICMDNTAEGEAAKTNLLSMGFKEKDIDIVPIDNDVMLLAEKEVVVNGETKTLKVISFRGSDTDFFNPIKSVTDPEAFKDSAADWGSNINIIGSKTTGVHTGFSETANKFISSSEFQNFKGNGDGSIFLVTGHSRGGAITSEVMNYMVEDTVIPESSIYGYTFGAPPTVNNNVGELTGLHQIVNTKDWVPKLSSDVAPNIISNPDLSLSGQFSGRGVMHTYNGGIIPIKNHLMPEYMSAISSGKVN